MANELTDVSGTEFPDFPFFFDSFGPLSLYDEDFGGRLLLLSFSSRLSVSSFQYGIGLSEIAASLEDRFAVVDVLVQDSSGSATDADDAQQWVFDTGIAASVLNLGGDEVLKSEVMSYLNDSGAFEYPVFFVVDPESRQVVSAFADYTDAFSFESYVNEVYDLYAGGGGDDEGPRGAFDEPGEIFPNLAFVDQTGESVRLLESGGSADIMVVSICGLWCRPCQIYSQDLDAIQAAAGERFDFVEIMLEDFGFNVADTADAQIWANQFNLDEPVLSPGGDEALRQQIYEGMSLEFFPSYVVLDRSSGEILEIIEGYGGVEVFAAQLTEIADARQPEVEGMDIKGGTGSDALFGDAGDDDISGGNGSDILSGESGDDALDGGNGADVLIGGRGNDAMVGGRGPDEFVFGEQFGEDLILDFEVKTDKLNFSGLITRDEVRASAYATADGLVIETVEGTVTLIGLSMVDIGSINLVA